MPSWLPDWKFGDVLTLRDDWVNGAQVGLKTMFIGAVDHGSFRGADLNDPDDCRNHVEIKDARAFEKVDD